MKWTLINQAGANDPDTGDIYSGLDRFGRVKDNRWIDGDGDDLDRIQYGYDRAGNRLWRHNVVAAALDKEFDEIYAYDGVHRLQDMARGTLNAQRTALTSETFAQCWTLDATGNWRGFREDDNGDGTWNLIQQRTANPVNEITDIAETAGPTWVTPAYSPAGNMTTMPKVADPAVSQTCQYDAWNRLTKVSEGANTVAQYQYDGAKRCIVQKSYDSGVLSETRHLYYTEPSKWQAIEERVGTSPDSADAERQFVWGLRYIDDCVLRDRDTDADALLDERLCACQDANWNVTSLFNESEMVQERYTYSAYGQPAFLTPSFDESCASAVSWTILYCGYRWNSVAQLYTVRNRVLHSALGVWLQRDPITASINVYDYIESHPLHSTDPTGNVMFPSGVPTGPFVTPGSMRGCYRATCFLCYGPLARGAENQLRMVGIRDRDDQGGGNAFLHCLISCRVNHNCSLCNPAWDMREEHPDRIGDRQDLANNAAGRGVAGDCWNGCMQLWRNGGLTCQAPSEPPQLVDCPPPQHDYRNPYVPPDPDWGGAFPIY